LRFNFNSRLIEGSIASGGSGNPHAKVSARQDLENECRFQDAAKKSARGMLRICLVRMNASDPRLLVVSLRILERDQSSQEAIGPMIGARREIENCCESGRSVAE
jgi:hypothetical protein